MRHGRWLAGGLGGLAALGLASAAAAPHKPPRTPQGAADLQGFWGDLLVVTPLERPKEFAAPTISDAQAAEFERRFNDPQVAEAEFRKAYPKAPYVGGDDWMGDVKYRLGRIAGQARISILIDPADGQLPLRPEARSRLRAQQLVGRRKFDDPEARPLAERCLIIPGPPMVEGDELQIVQTPDHVAIDVESAQGPRIVRLRDRRHGPAAIPRWMGDSVGWYEGDTLVVETTGFDPHANWTHIALSPHAKVTERFSRTSPTELLYRFTVEDPENYTHPWSGVMALSAMAGRMRSYECHEGNYALPNILAGARQVEADGGTPEPIDGGDPPADAAKPQPQPKPQSPAP